MTRRNEWNETLEQTIERSQALGGLLVYSMMPGEEIEVMINGESNDGMHVEESRLVRATCIEPKIGGLEVTADSATRENWTGKHICLGSYAFSLGGIVFSRAGLLRGMINMNNGVVVDFSAQHFNGEPPTYLMAEYQTLSLQDQRIF